MYERIIKYTDYDGNERVEKHYFNLNKAELIKLMTTDGDYTLDKKIERLWQERNGEEIMKLFENLIYLSYGKKSVDGRRFDKSEETKRDFMETEAYSELFTELITDAKKAGEFFNAIVPKEMAEEMARIMKENPDGIPDELRDYIPDSHLPVGPKLVN